MNGPEPDQYNEEIVHNMELRREKLRRVLGINVLDKIVKKLKGKEDKDS
ncbi:MAG TPA: hypothetical protein VMR16_01715 [Candidatus Saccharimonadales bacterium]|nr:hypothetical protein [Candidatus Saccharimonadales bacterium]